MHSTTHVKWATPPLDFFKINLDGATSDLGRHSGMGIIIRNYAGNPIGALSKPLPSDYPTLITEAIALHQGVLFALEM